MARAHAAAHGGLSADDNMTAGKARPRARMPKAMLASALFAGALALAGCAGGEALDGATEGTTAGSVGGVTNTQPGATMTVGSGPDAQTFECPSITVRTGASTFQSNDSSGRLRYQANLGQLARECAISGNQMTARLGIEGRVLLGEAGSPGTVNLPIRVAVVEEGPTPRTITTRLFNVPVTIPPGESQATFTVVEDTVSFPLGKTPADMERHVIYVGYDPQGQRPQAGSRPAQRQQSRPAASRAAPAEPRAPATTSAPAASTPAPAAPAASSAPPSDVFGPPPSGGSAAGGFAPPPSSSAFEPPPSAKTN